MQCDSHQFVKVRSETADVSNAVLERGQGERHLLSPACEQRVKFSAVFGSRMKISTYMPIILLTAIITAE